METKQSSIEWLQERMPTAFKNLTINKDLLEQAKEMHKKEIVDAYKFGISDEYVIGSEEYYNKTFGK